MKRMKIATKLLMLTAILLLFMVVLGILGIFNLSRMDGYITSIYDNNIVPLRQLQNISDAYQVNFLASVEKAQNEIYTFPEALEQMNGTSEIVTKNLEAYMATDLTEKEEKLVNELVDLRKNSKAMFEEAKSILGMGENDSSRTLLDHFIKVDLYTGVAPFTEKLDEMMQLQLDAAHEVNMEADQVYKANRLWNILLIFLAVIIGVSSSVLIILGITRSLKSANESVDRLSQGDLTVEFDDSSSDEIGVLMKNLRAMTQKVKDVVGNIISGAESIASAGAQLSSTSQLMSQGATEQASSVEEVSSSMEEMVSNIQQNADNSKQAESISQGAANGIEQLSSASARSLDSVHKITDKIKIINDIAFQTNILALNAAVEAARAGEYGRGFAVVAAEVRKLAERSKVSADEIVTLAETSKSATEEVVHLMENIVPEIQKTSKLVQEITAASMEQNAGADQINNAIQQMNQITQQNAAASEEMATSSEELASQADQLKDTVSFFSIGVHSTSVTSRTVARTQVSNRKTEIPVRKPVQTGKKNPAMAKAGTSTKFRKSATGGVQIDLSQEHSDSDFENF